MKWLLFLLSLCVSSLSANLILKDGGEKESAKCAELFTRMETLERISQEQETILKQQAVEVSRQESLLQQQADTIRAQSADIQRLTRRLSRRERDVSALESRVKRKSSETDTRVPNTATETQTVTTSPEEPSPSRSNQPAARQEHSQHVSRGQDDVMSEPHDVIRRSDDAGPLEVVVNQLSQRVSEIGAEVQAFKAQTANDFGALKTQTANDFGALGRDMDTMKNASSAQAALIQDARSSDFVRWGRSSCPSPAQLVYAGVVGGSFYNDNGGAANYLCLTLSPIFSSPSPASGGASLWGGEYQAENTGYHDKDPVCAVCRTPFTTTLMIPGTNVCTPGWHKQYSGYLMAGYYNHPSASEFICVDSALESRMGSDRDENGKLLYFTVTVCGSLPCGPYVNNKVVTCVVCSK